CRAAGSRSDSRIGSTSGRKPASSVARSSTLRSIKAISRLVVALHSVMRLTDLRLTDLGLTDLGLTDLDTMGHRSSLAMGVYWLDDSFPDHAGECDVAGSDGWNGASSRSSCCRMVLIVASGSAAAASSGAASSIGPGA